MSDTQNKSQRRPAARAGAAKGKRPASRAGAPGIASRAPSSGIDDAGSAAGVVTQSKRPTASRARPAQRRPAESKTKPAARLPAKGPAPSQAPAFKPKALPAQAGTGAAEDCIAEVSDGESSVLITGICGRMGRLLARRLHRETRVIGIDRRRFEGKPADIVHHQIDLRRRKLRDVIRCENVRAVVHLGTMHNLRESDRTHHIWNVVGFQKLLEHIGQFRVPKLVVLSSATLYGPSPENSQFLSEDAPLLGAQDFFQIRDLVEVDMLAQSFFWKEPQIETVILRPCHILGKVRNAPSNYVRMERPITVMGFDPMMQVIHERDVIEAIVSALKPGIRGVYNLRGPGELPLSRMIRMTGKKPMAVPGPLIRSVVGRLWTYRAVSFPTPELDHLRYVCLVDGRRARDELGFAPRYGLEATLRAPFAER